MVENNTPENEISCVKSCVGIVDEEIFAVSGGVNQVEISTGPCREVESSNSLVAQDSVSLDKSGVVSNGVHGLEVSTACHSVENHGGVSVAPDPVHLDVEKNCCVVLGGVSGGKDSGGCESVPDEDSCGTVKDQISPEKSVSCVVCLWWCRRVKILWWL